MKKFVTVFIPVFNGEKYLCELIEAVLSQEIPKGYNLELMVTDSGSTDRSNEILRAFGDKIIFDEIPNSEFGHGKTRQQAASRAKGDYVVFLSQDATPSHRRWLINMIEPFFLSTRVGCVYGRQVPRVFAVPTIKREVSSVFNVFGLSESIVIQRTTSLVDGVEQAPLDPFFSDVNSAIRKDLIDIIPFRDVAYAEDQALAKDLQEAGFLKAYTPQGSVWHSNEYTIGEYRKRKFDEYSGLQYSVGHTTNPSIRSLLLGWIRPTLADWSFIADDRDYTPYLKLKYILIAPLYNIANEQGKYSAAKYSGDAEKRKQLSLEQQRKP